MNRGFIGVALAVGGNPIMRKSALALVATSALLVGLPAAKANFISIGASLDGGGITTLASGGGTASVSGAAVGSFEVSASGTGNPPLTGNSLFDSNTIDVASAGSGVDLHIFVSETGQTTPSGIVNLESSFTQNLLTAGWTVLSQTFADNTDAVYGKQQLMNSFTSTTSDVTSDQTSSPNLGAGFYSFTAEFTITAPTAGQTNNTTDIVPGPIVGAGLPGLIAGCGFLIALARRRRSKAA
jgi:hypothetical protein